MKLNYAKGFINGHLGGSECWEGGAKKGKKGLEREGRRGRDSGQWNEFAAVKWMLSKVV